MAKYKKIGKIIEKSRTFRYNEYTQNPIKKGALPYVYNNTNIII